MRERLFKIAAALVFSALFACSAGHKPVLGKMLLIPEGEFVMGSDDADTEGFAQEFGMREGKLYENEKPVRKVFLKAYYIDAYEVTNIEYKSFVSTMNYPQPLDWKEGAYAKGKELHPVVNVSWHDAASYCRWAGKRLPTEEEWEKASRGANGGKYPWGETYDEKAANMSTNSTAPVGSFDKDKSPFGVYDLGGNVMEWVEDVYEPYPGNKSGHKDYGKGFRVVRGGTAGLPGHYVMNNVLARGASRRYAQPQAYGVDTGFRCAKTPENK